MGSNSTSRTAGHFPRRHLIFVGAFPPPVHGMAIINAAMLSQLQSSGDTSALVLNVAAPSLRRAFSARLGRLPRIFRAAVELLKFNAPAEIPLYLSISGGYGQIYELVIIGIARLRGMKLFVHHHSFAYLNSPSQLTRLLIWLAGSCTLHVVLSDGMGAQLRSSYPSARNVLPLSNVAFMPATQASPAEPRQRLSVLGFLSNISEEKGVFDFLEACERALANELPITAILAGPFQSPEIEGAVMRWVEKLSNVVYVGPKYGDQKDDFFRSIDVLLFPTKYPNEAEPVTIHEAMRAGVPVVAFARGAISEVLPDGAGLAMPITENFAEKAIEKISEWLDDPSAYRQACEMSVNSYCSLKEKSETAWNRLQVAMRQSCQAVR